ncbi:YbjN domain-containing protein [Brevibacterium luteolum]|uniref:YbjN domain-containing protein n=1 Tax=Brevibacterium luteolum TaxID=199591 RepID=UPI00223C2D64|nr:YbjN domain-containing protein [Brevibacterium luteolum]MCT1872582.1 YbjN domain-containing protein [Brevibacterium luteolum]MCT1890555.1 YbjN domain-containing protein [Brevibacterium luteolum]MCT1893045.1 YbjN domain-containing protein [Brevibacterium luteolum]MCT1923837.1 YbjN domain-containing protein [Brevibacterium luteolum]
MPAPAVTLDRIAEEFDDLDVGYELDEEHIATILDGIALVVMSPQPPVLMLTGRWLWDLQADEDVEKALALAHEFNERAYQPRLTVEEGEDENEGTAHVYFSCSMPAGTGMTDEQLTGAVEMGLQAMSMAAAALCDEFPHLEPSDTNEEN